MRPSGIRPDLILLNGDFRTQDPARPKVQALAVGAGRILGVGDNTSIAALASPETERLDLDGRLGLPGFLDIHFHYYDWALSRRNLNLAGLPSFGGLIAAVKKAAKDKGSDDWIVGLGFNEADWPEKRLPTRDDLDLVSPRHPVLLWRCDLHLAVANSLALAIAGITADTPDPTGGWIARDESDRPTGILREQAINLIKNVLPQPQEKQIIQALGDGIPIMHSMGITGLHDIRLFGDAGGATAFRAWQLLQKNGDLRLRTWVTIPGELLDAAIALGLTTGFGDDRLRIGHVKFFADGGMGARTAWMIDPYLDAERGMPLIPPDELKNLIIKASRAGLACAVHAVGDRANHELIRIYAKLANQPNSLRSGGGPASGLSHRIEHLQMVRPEDIRRLAQLNVTVSMQPHNTILDMEMIDACVGSNAKYTYAFRSVLEAGVNVCFSSDAPVCDPNPLVNIQAAVTRCRQDGTPSGGWYPDQRVSVEAAVRAYTQLPAIASGAGDELGSLAPGKRADVVVLDHNIFSINPSEITATNIDLTLFDGQVVHRSYSL
jgi:predicted amidohydrolase YtcJ